jgi:hypothetical protein
MARKLYQLTEQQLKKYQPTPTVPTDEEFQARWAKSHHGEVNGWGMGKRTWIMSQMAKTAEYQRGIWQGRVDRARGLDYAEERNENVYNLGYYRGYTNYESDRRGWDAQTRAWFDSEYTEVAE